jgi:hypothetical protein
MSGSLPLPQTDVGFRNLAFGVLSFVLVFNIATYSYYRGSVLTPSTAVRSVRPSIISP